MNITLESYCQYTQDYFEKVKRQVPFSKERRLFAKTIEEYNRLYSTNVPKSVNEDTELTARLNQRIKVLSDKEKQIEAEFKAKYPKYNEFYEPENVIKFLHIMCGSEEKYNALPVLDIKKPDERLGDDSHEFIKHLPPMSAPVMRGTDRLKRAFVAVSAPIDGWRVTFTILQQYDGWGDFALDRKNEEKIGPVACLHCCQYPGCALSRTTDVELFKKVHELITTGQTTLLCGAFADHEITYKLGVIPK